MIDIEAMKRRKKLRVELLEELYTIYFNSEGQLNNSLLAKSDELMGKRRHRARVQSHKIRRWLRVYSD